MRHAIVAVASVCLMVLLTVVGMFALASPPPVEAAAEPVVDCRLVVGNPARVICDAAGVQVLNTVVDLPTQTITLPPATVTLPGTTVTVPSDTQTVRVPGPTVTAPGPTVTVPGPTQTATVKVPGQGTTATVTLPPEAGATETKTVRPNGKPVPTKTVTIQPEIDGQDSSPSPSGQAAPERGTLEEDTGFISPEVDLGDGEISVAEAGLGFLTIIALAMVGLLAVYGGYRLGRKSAVDEDTEFLRTLLDSVKIKR